MPLDYSTYQQIKANELVYAAWYEKTYSFFINHPLDSIADFWKIVAFAYAWMPTIPKLHLEKLEIGEEALLLKLQALKNGDIDQLESLFNILVPVINNSVVGTSKVLHFIAPSIVPIYDSRVVLTWNALFADNAQLSLKQVRGKIPKVLFYSKKMHQWQANCQESDTTITLRDLEIALYGHAKKLNPK